MCWNALLLSFWWIVEWVAPIALMAYNSRRSYPHGVRSKPLRGENRGSKGDLRGVWSRLRWMPEIMRALVIHPNFLSLHLLKVWFLSTLIKNIAVCIHLCWKRSNFICAEMNRKWSSGNGRWWVTTSTTPPYFGVNTLMGRSPTGK